MINRFVLVAVTFIWCCVSATGQDVVVADWYTKKTSWNGNDQYHFQIAKSSGYLVVPQQAMDGNPWIWRARFPNYHAEMDIELVKQGFHIGYFEVGGQFGCPDAIDRANEFYEFMVHERGLAKKPVLEGVSRGGLFVYNWTAKHPSSVAGIYCDTPVCDFLSWPGGKGTGIGSVGAWKQCLTVYGLSDQEAMNYRGRPVDHAETIAKAKIPILHIVSDNDRVVPPKENTDVLHDALKQHGHNMQIIRVAEGTAKSHGHHFQHPDPERVIEFIRQAAIAGQL